MKKPRGKVDLPKDLPESREIQPENGQGGELKSIGGLRSMEFTPKLKIAIPAIMTPIFVIPRLISNGPSVR